MTREMFATDTAEAYGLLKGLRRKATRILKKGGHTLILLHLISHRALHIASNINDAVVGTHDDDIAISQADIARETTIEDIIIDIDNGQLTTATIDLDITERTQTVDTASHIKGMEHGGKGGKCISAWGRDLTHHIDGDGAGLSDRHANAGLAITLTQLVLDLLIGLRHSQSPQVNRSESLNNNRTFR